jgi:hypothetical protein
MNITRDQVALKGSATGSFAAPQCDFDGTTGYPTATGQDRSIIRRKHLKNCPNCGNADTTRISRSFFQRLVFAQSARFQCRCCSQRFLVRSKHHLAKSGDWSYGRR